MAKLKTKLPASNKKFFSRKSDSRKDDFRLDSSSRNLIDNELSEEYEDLFEKLKSKLAQTIEEELRYKSLHLKKSSQEIFHPPDPVKKYSPPTANNLEVQNQYGYNENYYRKPDPFVNTQNKPNNGYINTRPLTPAEHPNRETTNYTTYNYNHGLDSYKPRLDYQVESIKPRTSEPNSIIRGHENYYSDKKNDNSGSVVRKDDTIGASQEKLTFLEKELLASYQRESKLKTRIDELEIALNKAEVGLSAQISDLKQDIPVVEAKKEENKLSLLSEQLASVMKTISSEVSNQDSTIQSELDNNSDTKVVDSKSNEEKNETEDDVKQAKPKNPKENKSDDNKKSGKKKYFAIFFVIILIIVGISAGGYFWLNRSAGVDEELLQQYLPEGVNKENDQSNVPDINQDSTNDVNQGGEVQGASTVNSDNNGKYSESYADVDYAETRWETHKNPQLGIEFDYPSNSTNVVRTDTSVTVLRKTGYIFKIQYIESALDLDSYWKQVKARNLTYKASEKNFRDYPALFLELAEPSDYPGNRYLVKKDDVIYDIWYATNSKNLNDDDAKRVDVMLNSLKFLV